MDEKCGGELTHSFLVLKKAFEEIVSQITRIAPENCQMEHLRDTPRRLANAYLKDYFWGLARDPRVELGSGFLSSIDEMIFITEIPFESICAHHFIPFIGKVHFAYLPHGKIIGLSKVPKMIDVLAHRPQVQEELTEQIADTFLEALNGDTKPLGVGVVVEAEHFCLALRGAKKRGVITKTHTLRGDFLNEKEVRQEFFDGISR